MAALSHQADAAAAAAAAVAAAAEAKAGAVVPSSPRKEAAVPTLFVDEVTARLADLEAGARDSAEDFQRLRTEAREFITQVRRLVWL